MQTTIGLTELATPGRNASSRVSPFTGWSVASRVSNRARHYAPMDWDQLVEEISTCIQAIKDKGTTIDFDADESCAEIRMINQRNWQQSFHRSRLKWRIRKLIQ
jgi:hypothetical protein